MTPALAGRTLSVVFIMMSAYGPERLAAQSSWLEVSLPVQDTTLFRISFVDSFHGWIAGRSGVILATTDGGNTWRADSVVLPYRVFEFKFVSPSVGWLLASNAGQPPGPWPGLERALYKSTDAGLTWFEIILPDSFDVTAISFTSENLVRVAAPALWATTDGGQSWELRSSLPGVASLDFYDDLTGYAGGGWLFPSPYLLETTDGGYSWMSRWSWTSEGTVVFRLLDGRLGSFWLLYFHDEPPQWIERLWVTWNRGVSQRGFVNFPFSPDGFHLGWATDSVHVWLLRRNGRIVRIQDQLPWEEDTLGVPVVELLCDTYSHRFALGGGRLFRFDSSTPVADTTEQPRGFALFQNYPNPFNPVTTIRYSLPVASYVTLKVYDALGREIATLTDEKKDAGVFVAQWDMTDRSSGVYIYRMLAQPLTSGQAPMYILTKKAVLLK
jgi:photosystem II stability/assembly factor-like uncharacterized protein